jgi:hypothetical protein
MKYKICSKCATVKSLDLFYRDVRANDGHASQCKECSNKVVNMWRKNHKEQLTKINRKSTAKWRTTIRGHLWSIFDAMLQRCRNPNAINYKNYGGRGIKVNFKNNEQFIKYCLGSLETDPRGLDIDRIDNNGHYEKGNIRFVTRSENNKNRRPRV